MSYLTGRCEVCDGTARVHKEVGTVCTEKSDCAGCVRCRDCIDGKVVSMPGGGGAKRSGTIGPMRINTVRRHNRQASAEAALASALAQSPTRPVSALSTEVVDDIFNAYGDSPSTQLPQAPILTTRRRTIIEEMVVMLERPLSPADAEAPPLADEIIRPARSSSFAVSQPEPIARSFSFSASEPRAPAALLALFEAPATLEESADSPVVPSLAPPVPSARKSSIAQAAYQSSAEAHPADLPQQGATDFTAGAESSHSVPFTTSLHSIRDQEEPSPVDTPILGDANLRGSQTISSRAASNSEMSARQHQGPEGSPKGEKKKSGLNGIFSKRKKSETPTGSTIPQSLHGQNTTPPEVRERSKTADPNSGKGLFSRMRKTSSFGKIPDASKVGPEATAAEEIKVVSDIVAVGPEPVLVDGGGAGGAVVTHIPAPQAFVQRRSAAGPRIQTIVHDLNEDAAPRPIPQRQYESIELLNDRAVARNTKPIFEERPELRKSYDNLQVDKKSKLAAEIFSFGKKKKGGEPHSATSFSSVGPAASNLAAEAGSPRSMIGSPQGSSPMHGMSGGVAVRKSKRPLCVLTPSSQMDGSSDTASPASSAATPYKEHRRTPSRNFKDWYSKYANEAVKQHLEDQSGDRRFADPITLEFIFGSKVSGPKDAVHAFAKASRCYETCRRESRWACRGANEAPGPSRGRDQSHLDLVDDIAYKYRPLDIFYDGKLKGIAYSHSAHGPVLDIVVAGKGDDLLDALVFPLEQDMSYAEVFLATYRFYMPSGLLMDSLIEWYNVDVDTEVAATSEDDAGHASGGSPDRPQQDAFLKKYRKHIRSRVVRILMMWIKNHWHDFQEDGTLFKMLQAFVDHISSIGFGDGQKLSQAVREQVRTVMVICSP